VRNVAGTGRTPHRYSEPLLGCAQSKRSGCLIYVLRVRGPLAGGVEA